ncbi:hypothetical protein LTS10_000460 [Elasticomyces elasticus]|nr:hypothetical protein LTS10_000460 [Elasticomyces elasticus]
MGELDGFGVISVALGSQGSADAFIGIVVDYLSPGFKDIFGRSISGCTLELFEYWVSDFEGVRGCVYFAFGKITQIISEEELDMIGYAGVSTSGEHRKDSHLTHILLPSLFKKQQKLHRMCRERDITPSFIVVGQDTNLHHDFQELTRESIESTVIVMMGLVSKESNRRVHYDVAKRLQPPDTATRIFLAGNCELSIMRAPLVYNGTRNWYKVFPCIVPDCKEEFISVSAAESHLATEHPLPPLYFVCPQPDCGRGFSQPSGLATHSEAHSTDLPYICGDCGVRYKQSSSLVRHQLYGCALLRADCGAPGCDEKGSTLDMSFHRMACHDYCLDCESVLTYDKHDLAAIGTVKQDFVAHGTVTLRQQHICTGNQGIIAYYGFKCTVSPDCSYVLREETLLPHRSEMHKVCS